MPPPPPHSNAAHKRALSPSTHDAPAPQGFDAYLASKEALRKRQARGFKLEDRLFSLSSRSSPLVRARLCVCPCTRAVCARLRALLCLPRAARAA
jgi:hypothetical protein